MTQIGTSNDFNVTSSSTTQQFIGIENNSTFHSSGNNLEENKINQKSNNNNIINNNKNNNICNSKEIDDCIDMYQYLENHDFICPTDEDQTSGSVMWTIIKRLKSGTDLTRISLPVSILRPASLLEVLAIYSTPNEIIKSINRQKKMDRMKTVIAWFTYGLKKAPQNKVFGTKPYNPVLGEIFKCHWNHNNNITTFNAEQVSHHPPISSFHMENRTYGFQYFGTFEAKTMFRGNSVDTELSGKGYVILTLPETNEKEIYRIDSMPSMSAKGLIWGKQRVILNGNLSVTCPRTDLHASIDVLPDDGDGEPQLFKGYISKITLDKHKTGKQFYRITAKIGDYIKFTNLYDSSENSEDENDDDDICFNFHNYEEPKRNVRKISEQDENESRRLWHNVTKAIVEEDEDKANQEKYRVEENERQLRKYRHNQSITWKPQLFEYSDYYNVHTYKYSDVN